MRSCHVTKRFRILATLQQGNESMYSNTSGYCKVFVQPIFSFFSVYFPDICVQTEIGYLSTVLDSVGISQSGISVVLH